ncbi:MAG TPA: DUF2157 domain-containing protein [Candidatus Acidoferrales bacterium]|nr:DUF2157 domain-containing protein [Candidatus Acidoferrales bacterium]
MAPRSRRPHLKPESKFESQIARWLAAGVIDAAAAERIRAFEAGDEKRATFRWPAILALAIGGLLVAASITLFVAAHWDRLSPTECFAIVLFMVAAFHVAAAFAADKFSALSVTFHAIGTIAFGAGIFLTGQIFNLQENWATGILLWAAGAAAGYAVLRQWPQAALFAVLAPSWLVAQWGITTRWGWRAEYPISAGLMALAAAYLSARRGAEDSATRKALAWIGGIALLPACVVGIWAAVETSHYTYEPWRETVSAERQLAGWAIAILVPLAVGWLLSGAESWKNALAVAWACLATVTAIYSHTKKPGAYVADPDFGMIVLLYAVCALGAAGLILWGFSDRRKERVNLGIAGFALTVLFFYFDGFMDKLDRSLSLLLLGVICIAGGYALERTRRRLVAKMEAAT